MAEVYRGQAVIERKGYRIYVRIGDEKLAKELDKATTYGNPFYFRWPVPVKETG